MYIQYYGLGCFRLTTTTLNILVDPIDSKTGLSAPRGGSDIVLLTDPLSSQKREGLSGHVVDRPGEMDIGECSIVGLPSADGDVFRTVYWVDVGGVKLVLSGGIKEWKVDSDDFAALGDIDVLFVPVGGHGVMDTAGAVKVARDIEAKIIIPTHFALPGLKTDLDPVDKFLKEMAFKGEPTDKLKVTTKDLPVEGSQVAYLTPSK
jgi:L-ascorbate metabolism protein UlaG (beta-lactamase superfamily)